MRAGNAKATSPDPLGAVNWKCLNPGSIENTPGMPKKPCLNGLRAEISFPKYGFADLEACIGVLTLVGLQLLEWTCDQEWR